jgi:hypothetical protein
MPVLLDVFLLTIPTDRPSNITSPGTWQVNDACHRKSTTYVKGHVVEHGSAQGSPDVSWSWRCRSAAVRAPLVLPAVAHDRCGAQE